jgi:hypothetical protein
MTPHGVVLSGGVGVGLNRKSRRVVDEFSSQGKGSVDSSSSSAQEVDSIADFVVWLGDLNYRIDMGRSEVVEVRFDQSISPVDFRVQSQVCTPQYC